MARKLKESTIKSYSLAQLVNHAELYQDKHDVSLFRFSNVSSSHVMVFQYDAAENSYFFHGQYDKSEFVDDVLSAIYRSANNLNRKTLEELQDYCIQKANDKGLIIETGSYIAPTVITLNNKKETEFVYVLNSKANCIKFINQQLKG
jgi:hypothetical protein